MNHLNARTTCRQQSENFCTNTSNAYTRTHTHISPSLQTFTDTETQRRPPYFLSFFDIHVPSWHNTSLYGEPTHRLDKLEPSQQGDASAFSLFVVFACLAVVSLDDYQTHRHSSHNPVCLTDMGLPAGKVKSEQDQRRWIPLWAALIVQTSQRKKNRTE